jgi:glycosyltransferase involved in cell wall biosynthesis
MKVSVITVTRNAVNTLERTILSVLGQDYNHRELIIIDGNSTDGTLDIIRKHESSIDYWISEPDRGIYHAMNKGIAVARGDWINFLNAGDVYSSMNILSRIMESVTENNDVVYGDSITKYPHFHVLRKAGKPEHLWKGMSICHQSIWFRSSLARNLLFQEEYHLGADYNLLIQLYKTGASFHYLPIAMTIVDPGGISNRMMWRSAMEHLKISRHHLKLSSGQRFQQYCMIAILTYVSMIRLILPEHVYQSLLFRYRHNSIVPLHHLPE